MANKKITDLQLISTITDAVNIPGDPGTQTYRFTAAQMSAYINAKQGASRNVLNGGTSGGAANAQTLTPTIPLTAYGAGTLLYFVAGYSNTGAATLAVSGLASPKAIKNLTGGDLVTGDIVTGQSYSVYYNGTDFILIAGSVQRKSISSIQNATYAVLMTDETVRVSGSGGAFTATLPTAVGCAGKVFKFIRTDSTFANAVTLATTSSQTINAKTTFKLMTLGEMVSVMSDGANWLISDRYIPSVPTAVTITGTWTTNTAYTAYWTRMRNWVRIDIRMLFSGQPQNTGNIITLPTGFTIDTAAKTSDQYNTRYGYWNAFASANSSQYVGTAVFDSTTTLIIANMTADAGSNPQPINQGVGQSRTNPFTIANNSKMDIVIEIPVLNWEG